MKKENYVRGNKNKNNSICLSNFEVSGDSHYNDNNSQQLTKQNNKKYKKVNNVRSTLLLHTDNEITKKIKSNKEFKINGELPQIISSSAFQVNYNENFSCEKKYTQTIISGKVNTKVQQNKDKCESWFESEKIRRFSCSFARAGAFTSSDEKLKAINEFHLIHKKNILKRKERALTIVVQAKSSINLPKSGSAGGMSPVMSNVSSCNSISSMNSNKLKQNLENINTPGCYVNNSESYNRVLEGFVYLRTLPYMGMGTSTTSNNNTTTTNSTNNIPTTNSATNNLVNSCNFINDRKNKILPNNASSTKNTNTPNNIQNIHIESLPHDNNYNHNNINISLIKRMAKDFQNYKESLLIKDNIDEQDRKNRKSILINRQNSDKISIKSYLNFKQQQETIKKEKECNSVLNTASNKLFSFKKPNKSLFSIKSLTKTSVNQFEVSRFKTTTNIPSKSIVNLNDISQLSSQVSSKASSKAVGGVNANNQLSKLESYEDILFPTINIEFPEEESQEIEEESKEIYYI